MTTVELDHSEPQVEELERLWATPAAAPRRREPPAPSVAARLPRLLAVGWVALPAAALLGWLARIGPALGVSAVAGCIGVVLGYACHASEHHLGAWWLVEAG